MSQRLHAAVAGFALFSLRPNVPGYCQITGCYQIIRGYRLLLYYPDGIRLSGEIRLWYVVGFPMLSGYYI